MALVHPDHERIIEGETLRGVQRDVRDLILSLRALTALLKNESTREEEAVLSRILDAELNQLLVLVGEVTTALQLEEQGTHTKALDLMQALHQAAKRSGVRVSLRLGSPVPITADPEVVSQVLQSALAIAVRSAESGVSVRADRWGDSGGVVAISFHSEPAGVARRRDARMHLLRKLVSALGGRVSVEKKDGKSTLRVFVPSWKSETREIG